MSSPNETPFRNSQSQHSVDGSHALDRGRRSSQEPIHDCRINKRSEGLLMTSERAQDFVQTKDSSVNGAHSATEHPIGRGAFGEVWSVIDPRSSQRIALKRLADVFSSRQLAIRVFREVTCLTALHHDNILSAFDILHLPSTDDFQDLFVLTEAMDSDLYKIIASNQPLTANHIMIFIYQILRGLKYLHSGKIIHRDIKPANLLVNANCSLKICDFGLVREDEVTSEMTQDVSTQYYRAPEMLMGAKHYTTSVDIWATGCVFAELISRRILFHANSPIQQLDLIMEVVGTPQMDDMKFACDAARHYILRKTPGKPEANSQLLECLSLPEYGTQDVVHLLPRLLVFNPEKRMTSSKALQSNYVKQGRSIYHSTICSCHPSKRPPSRLTVSDDLPSSASDFNDLEPIMLIPFSLQLQDLKKESSPSIMTIRSEFKHLCLDKQRDKTNPLHVNKSSSTYEKLTGTKGIQAFSNFCNTRKE